MKNLPVWLLIMVAVSVALLANFISTNWAKGDDKFTLWLVALLLISPIVFITFGLVTARLGLTVTSGTIDSLLTVSSILLGLIVFQEWQKVSALQCVGLGMALVGVYLMLFYPKTGV